MKRFLGFLVVAIAAATMAAPASAADRYTASGAVKLDVLGEWAHPDDDTSIIGPCGVWHQRYDVKCGIIMVTRGEGGGNAVGTEIGPALGLRRENEDRVAHFRSGTVDIFNLDRVDFFYNQSAPLTQFFWGQDETLRRVTRIIRMTQPEIYIGFTPTLGAGHGNHQQAGRYIWEGVKAAADPDMFPEQLTGPNALEHLAGQEDLLRRQHGGHGRDDRLGRLHHRLHARRDQQRHRRRRVDRLRLALRAGRPATSRASPRARKKIWEQVARRGHGRVPDAEPRHEQGDGGPGLLALRHDRLLRAVPAEREPRPPPARTTRSSTAPSCRTRAGCPRGRSEYLTFSRFYNVPGEPFDVSLQLKADGGRSPAGTAQLDVPAGWTVDARRAAPSARSRAATATWRSSRSRRPRARRSTRTTRSPAATRAGRPTGYTDDVVRVVSPAEGRFQRFGKWAEYDEWLEDEGSAARRLNRSAAIQSMGVGETITVPSKCTTGRRPPQSGVTSSLTLPAGMTADAASKPYGPLAPGADTTVNFDVSNSYTNATLPGAGPGPDAQSTTRRRSRSRRRTTRGGSGSENAAMSIVPKTSIPAAASAPALDGAEGAGEYTGEALDVGRKWEPGGSNRNCSPQGVDCGSSSAPGTAGSTYAKVTRNGDDLYFLVHVKDDFQSYAVTPAECVAHWQADSVELLIDPRGNASQARNRDTADTFKLAVFPFTNDPGNTNGNGANGPCWSRDADNHQGYSTGPLAEPGLRRPERPRRAGRDGRRVGRLQRHLRRPRLRRRRLHDRGQDPDGRPPGRRGPGPDGPEHHALRQRRQHGRDRLDEAAAHRHEHAPRVVDVRQRPVGSVPLGPRDPAGLHAAGGPPDHARRTRTCPTPTSTARSRRRRSRSPRATASRSPVGSPPPRATASPRRRPASRPPRSSST